MPIFRRVNDLFLHDHHEGAAPGVISRAWGPVQAASPAEADALAVRPGDGADTVTGTTGADGLAGAGGADVISGGGGNDILYGFGPADRDPNSGAIVAERVAEGLERPLFAVSPPGDPDRLFIVEQHSGRILILDTVTGQIEPTPFLDLPEREIRTGGEQGLLGLAFHPDYEANGKFYVFLTNIEGTIEVREYTRSADPDVANTTHKLVLSIPHPDFANHNGGWMDFGPDGYLYIAVGDGGGVGDPDNSAQDLNSLLGKMLRIDVDGDDFPGDATRNYAIPEDNPFVGEAGADEVWAYGLRNPWRCSFDPVTGDLYIADVGQGAREEINFVPAGSPGGLNFGWHVREGDLPYDTNTPGNPAPTDPSLVDPVAVYPHVNGPTGGRSITGGYAYYGPGGAQGQYFFADYVNNNIWTISVDAAGNVVDFTNRNGQIQTDEGVINQVNSFAVDGQGRLYVIGLDGEIFRLTPTTAAADGADQISGGDGNDRIYGGAGNDTLNGDGGADVMWGGIQNDSLNGAAGNDTLEGGAGADVLAGGADADIASYAGAAGAVGLNLASGVHTGDAAGDTFSGIEEFRLSAHGDSFVGGAGADKARGMNGADGLDGAGGSDLLYGGAGGDTLLGGDANDRLYGEAGADTLDGGDGDDLIYAGLDADSLAGGAGRDRLIGERGDDSYTGGAGADHFWMRGAAFGADVVLDFEDGIDRIRVSGVSGVNDYSDLTVSTNGDGWAVVQFPDGSSVTLTGVVEAQVGAADFFWG